MPALQVNQALLQQERRRRQARVAELRTVLGRILEPAPDQHVLCSTTRRLARLCGQAASAAEIVIAVQDLFLESRWGRAGNPKRRAFLGVGVRPGFSVQAVASYLQHRFTQTATGQPRKHKATTGLVAEWEATLREEGLEADRLVGAEARQSPHEHQYAYADAGDPNIGVDLREARAQRGELALEIPGFFTGRRKNPQREQIWRLAMVEGVDYPTIGKLVGRTPQAIKRVVQQVDERLDRHLRALQHTPEQLRSALATTSSREKSARYHLATNWSNYPPSERQVWELAVFQLASPAQIAAQLNLDPKQVIKVLRKHRARAKKPLDQI